MRPQRHRQAEGSSRGWFGRGRKQGLIGHWVFLVRQMRQGSWLHLSDEPAQDQGVFLKNNFIYLCIFPCSSVGRESACNADLGSISGSGRSPRGGNGNPLQYSCLENPTDKGAWQVWSMGSQESDMTEWLSTHTHTCFWLCWVFIAGWTFLQLRWTGASLKLRCSGFSLHCFFWQTTDSSACRLQQLRFLGARAQAQ